MRSSTNIHSDGTWTWDVVENDFPLGSSARAFDQFEEAERDLQEALQAARAGALTTVVTRTVSGGAVYAIVTRDGRPVIQGTTTADERRAQARANRALALLAVVR